MDLDKKTQLILSELKYKFYSKVYVGNFSKENLIDFSYKLGEIVPSGSNHSLVDEIISTKDKGESYVRMHNDKSYWTVPPRYLIMYIKKFKNCEKGETLLSDMYKSYKKLSEVDQENLMIKQHIFTSPKNRDRKVIIGNVVNLINQNNYFFRYRLDLFENDETIKLFDQKIKENLFDLKMSEGDLLVIDNWRLAHGRNETIFSNSGERIMYRTLIL